MAEGQLTPKGQLGQNYPLVTALRVCTHIVPGFPEHGTCRVFKLLILHKITRKVKRGAIILTSQINQETKPPPSPTLS